jgi:4-hydroxybenzoate polyprenyltransferase
MPGQNAKIAEKKTTTSLLRSWLELLRLPNLLTIPGDVALGYLIAERANHARLDLLLGFDLTKGKFESTGFIWATVATIALYIFGLVDNDASDAELDAKERPERPIPSGKISLKTAKTAAIAFMAAGLIAAFGAPKPTFHVAIILAILVYSYNNATKRNRLLGPLNMALCRLFSVILGYFAANGRHPLQEPALLVVGMTWLLYFTAVTMAAAGENDKKRSEGRFTILGVPFLWLATAPLATGALEVVRKVGEIPPSIFLAFAASIIFLAISMKNFIVFNSPNAPTTKSRAAVGELVRSIILIQSAGTAFLGYPYVALTLLLLWPVSSYASKWFQSS